MSKFTPTIKQKRRLPSCANGEGPVKIEGLGTFALVSVGNTRYTTGIEVHFQAEGQNEAAAGHIRFHIEIGEDLRPTWVVDRLTLDYGDHTGEKYGSRVFDAARAAVKSLYDRAPVSWGFHIDSAAEQKLEILKTRRRELLQNAQFAAEGAFTEKHKLRAKDRLAAFETRNLSRMNALKSVRAAWQNWCEAKAGAKKSVRESFFRVLDLAA